MLKNKIAVDFSKAAKQYEENANLQKIIAGELFAKAKATFNDNDKIIDIGCGTGFLGKQTRQEKLNWQLTQIDIAPEMCKIAQQNNYKTIIADMDDLPFNDGEFNGIISSLCLQWSNNLTHSFTEFRRISNGKILIALLGDKSLAELKSASSQLVKPLQISRLPKHEEIASALKKSGFKNIKITREVKKLNHDNVFHLLHNIKSIGARSKNLQKDFLGKTYFQQLAKIYQEEFSNIASWEVFYIEAS
jgi:malonyl-CoA O-methyltransferase